MLTYVSLFLAVSLGGLIGLEREKNNKDAGIRTVAMITLGACMYSIISMKFPNADPTRVIAQIVTGIGFIGGGVIFRNNLSINGLTTAATIWGSAAVGVLCGVQEFVLALVGTALIVFLNIIHTNPKKFNHDNM